MPASPETLRQWAYQGLGLAAEMEVDGYDPDVIAIFEAASGSLLVEAVKQERQRPKLHHMDIGPFGREPLAADVARRKGPAYYPAPPVNVHGIDAVGRWACCGHIYTPETTLVPGMNHDEHFDFCPTRRAEVAK